MSLADYHADNDQFETEDDGRTTGLAFPCSACRHQYQSETDEPCRICGHNLTNVLFERDDLIRRITPAGRAVLDAADAEFDAGTATKAGVHADARKEH